MITKEILEKSQMCSGIGTDVGTSCAFALAIRDIWPNAYVGRGCIAPFPIYVSDSLTAVAGKVFDVSRDMMDFILWFDHATSVERIEHDECSFELEVPDWVIGKIDIQDIINSPTLELVS